MSAIDTCAASLAAIRHCLAKGRIDAETRRRLQEAEAYEVARLRLLGGEPSDTCLTDSFSVA
jgi:hypothetical protein